MGWVVFALVIAVGVAMEVIAMRRCRSTIDQWSSMHRYQVASRKRRWFSAGAWGFWTSGSSRYFDLEVTDMSGRLRTGTAKISGGYGGVLANEIELRWEE